MQKNESIAMLLAGGAGSRLRELTYHNAKPAVTFGGKYRIIDFTLSNCVNSGIYTVGVLTQYQPLVLNEYIGGGEPWDLDRAYGGVRVLPPYKGRNIGDWYSGTANAIYQNLDFINRYAPEYVLVLSGDHIYKMDYSRLIEAHKAKKAVCTIATVEVDLSEASRFGIMLTDELGRIVDFEEKPKNPRGRSASMGIYVFSRAALERYLREDDKDASSSKDFGKDIIPKMLRAGERMFSYAFDGYWKDVGTLESLWQANMELLGGDPAIDFSDPHGRIYSRNLAAPPHYVGKNARVSNSIITEGCEIYGEVVNSVLSSGVIVERGASVRDSVIMSGVRIGEGARVSYSIMDSRSSLEGGGSLGGDRGLGESITVVGEGALVKRDGKIIYQQEKLYQ